MFNRLKFAIVIGSTFLTALLVIGAVMGDSSAADGAYRQLSVYTEVLSRIKSDYVEEPDIKLVTRGALQGLLESLDPNSSFEAGVQLTTELLREGKQFTALIAYDDMTALGALRALKKKGLRVPEDCSVIGFDDVAQAGLSVPSLTTVRQPMEAMGSLSAGMVLEAIKAVDQKKDIPVMRKKIPAELVVRESTWALK